MGSKSDYKGYSDAVLTDLLKSGDHRAFTELFHRYKMLLLIHADKMINDEDEAKDMVQEIFAVIWSNRENLNIKTNFAGLLFATVRNKVINASLHNKVKNKYLDSLIEFIETGVAETDHLVRTNILQYSIEKEISFLPPKMREVFELSRKHHLSHKEIALQLGVTEKTVRNQVTNALKILRTKFGVIVLLTYLAQRLV